jgi:adenine deaminase
MFSVKGKIVDVEKGTISDETIFVQDGRIKAIGADIYANESYDYSDFYIVPGFIDAHIHIESSMMTPSRFSDAVLPHGTVAVISDPHEIANVAGMDGINFMLNDSESLPLRVCLTAPSCVPATNMETAGASIGIKDVQTLLSNPRIVALGEVMNFPGVVRRDKDVMAKIEAAKAEGKPIDGHAPGLSGEGLKKYVEAGITTDHECTTLKEAREKLSLGMKIMIREGSSMKEMEALKSLISEENKENLMLVSDDLHPDDIINEGHVDRLLRKAVRLGADPIQALRTVTLNPARHYKFPFLGNVSIGMKASFVVVKDLKNFEVMDVFVKGELIVKDGKLLKEAEKKEIPKAMKSSIRTMAIRLKDLMVASKAPSRVRVISVPNRQATAKLDSDGGFLLPDAKNDILPIAVIERHKATGNIGSGFVKGFGLKSGAIASTVAHDSHNIVCTGTDYKEMDCAIRCLKKSGGGMVTVKDGKVLSLLELPVAGLMSDKPAEDVAKELKDIHKSVKCLGCGVEAPFMELAFLALPVIPELKITDKGLIDVKEFRIVPTKIK